MCYDALLAGGSRSPPEIEMPSYGDAKAPVPMAADPAALATIADRLLAAAVFRFCSPNMWDARPTGSTISWRSRRASAPPSTTSMPAQFPQPPPSSF